jgi:hypothetical protein
VDDNVVADRGKKMMMARQNSTTSSMMLAIAAGDAIALWDCSSDELDSAFQPHGIDSDVADIAWNHNGQGKHRIM